MSKEIEIKEAYEGTGYTLVAVTHERQYGKALRWMVEHVCPKGHRTKKRWRGQLTCSPCGKQANGDRVRIKDEEVVAYVQENAPGYKLNRNWIENKKARLSLTCPDEHTYEIDLGDFKKGRRCQQCYMTYGNPKLDEEIKKYFESEPEGYQLLEIYRIRRSYMMAYIHLKCPEGHDYHVHWNKFKGSANDLPRRCSLCASSMGEREIRRVLDALDISYEEQYRFQDCRDSKPLPFDFAVMDGDKVSLLIEYDGGQHFEPVQWSKEMTEQEAMEELEKTQYRDSIKNEYCKDKNIKLLRIPYWDYSNIEKILGEYI